MSFSLYGALSPHVSPLQPLPPALGHIPHLAETLNLAPGLCDPPMKTLPCHHHHLHPSWTAPMWVFLTHSGSNASHKPWRGRLTIVQGILNNHHPPAKLNRTVGNMASECRREIWHCSSYAAEVTAVLPLPEAALPQSHSFRQTAHLM